MFFEFLQIAIGNRKSLSAAIDESDWLRLFDFCKKQALLGIGFYVVEKLHKQGIECPFHIRAKWMALAFQIEKQSILLNEQCCQLKELYEHDGIATCILKGQGNLLNYPEALKNRRQCGDIDVWAIAKGDVSIAVQTDRDKVEYISYRGHQAIREYVKMQHRIVGNNDNPAVRYNHIDAPNMGRTPIEIHFRPSYCNSPLRNRRMQRWFNDHADVCIKNMTHMGFAVPTASVNVVYQMTHLFTHYFDEGLGLRQLMDYYFTLRVWHNDVMECKNLQSQRMWSEGLGTPVMFKEDVMSALCSFGMTKFTAAVMYVLHEVFAMPSHYYICEPNEKEGRKLLAEIMLGGNFGQYDERGKEMKNGGTILHAIWKLKRVTRLVSSYPEEALCEPFFRVWHWGWRLFH